MNNVYFSNNIAVFFFLLKIRMHATAFKAFLKEREIYRALITSFFLNFGVFILKIQYMF